MNYNSGEQDASIAATTMMYEAEELGIHSVWLRGFDAKTVSEVFELPSFGSVYNTIRKHLEGSLDRLQTDYVDACGIIGLNQESPINTGFERFGPFSLTRKAG